MSDKVIAFFDFKVDRCGILRIGVLEVCSRTLGYIGASSSMLQTSESRKSDRVKHAPTFLQISRSVHRMLNERIWIGHDIKSDVERLNKAFEEIGQKPPRATSIIDTLAFTLSGTKLAKIALQFGLGDRGRGRENDYCLENLTALKNCGDLVSLFEPDKEKNKEKNNGDDMHPMISHLIESADVTARFGELDIAS